MDVLLKWQKAKAKQMLSQTFVIQLGIENLQWNPAEAFVLLYGLLTKLRKHISLPTSQERIHFSWLKEKMKLLLP